jgi:hypothetical protein
MRLKKPGRDEQVAALLRKIEKKPKEPNLKLAVDNTKKKQNA